MAKRPKRKDTLDVFPPPFFKKRIGAGRDGISVMEHNTPLSSAIISPKFWISLNQKWRKGDGSESFIRKKVWGGAAGEFTSFFHKSPKLGSKAASDKPHFPHRSFFSTIIF